MNNFKVYLAPLEGLADGPMRKVLCRHGGYDLCFSEFIRISELPLSEKTLFNKVPEYQNDFKTEDGTPLRVQLLGDSPELMAKSAQIAQKNGAKSIDINFGCPSRFVHHSGAMLLKEPELMHEIVATVREQLDPSCTLSVKVRLGFLEHSEAPNIIKAIAQEGVEEITVHCRTRKGLYRDDNLSWESLTPLHELSNNITLIANGNIFSLKDALECSQITKCNYLMCGRGAFATPNLAATIKEQAKPYSLSQILKVDKEVIDEFSKTPRSEKIVMDRAKQFLGYARQHRPELKPFFNVFCRSQSIDEGINLLDKEISELEARDE